MTRGLVFVLALALALVPAAPAATLVERDGTRAPEPYQRWIDAAKVPTPSGVIRLDLTATGCDGYVCAYPWESPPRIVLFRDSFDRYTRYDTLHEVGHVFSYRHRNGRFRRAFMRIFGERRWNDEWFAQAYSWCATNPTYPAYYNYPGYGYWPTIRQHRAACRLIASTRETAPPWEAPLMRLLGV